MSRPTYVYRVVVEKWPDWCPDGWERVYSDVERFPSFGPDFEGDTTLELPDGLRSLMNSSAVPRDFPAAPDVDGWHHVVCPKRGRTHWLSGASAHRWVRHARFLGATAHVERGQVADWEARP